MAPHSSTLAWEIPWTGGAWWATVHGVAKSRTRLRDFTFIIQFHALKKEMATHFSILDWEIPWTGGAWWATLHGVTKSQALLSDYTTTIVLEMR